MTRVLLTGATGFLGRHVAAALHATGQEVHGVTHSSLPPESPWAWHRVDILDRRATEAAVRDLRPDVLMHLAWCAQPPHYWTDPANIAWLSATLDLVRVFHESGGRRVVGVGTCAEYDWSMGHCIERVTPLRPFSLYGTTKAACGTVLEAYGRQVNLSIAWARVFFLFGPHDDRSRLIPSILHALDSGEPAQCRTGSYIRDFIHVEDAAAALVALLSSDVTGPVNIASGTPMRVAEVAAAVAKHTAHPELLQIADEAADHPRVTADVARLREEVGWSPTIDMTTRIDETVGWWRSRRGHSQGD